MLLKHIKIALTGKMRSGKDTVYGILKDEFKTPSLGDKQVTQYTFGSRLKYFAHELFPDELSKGKPRKLYQEFGQLMRQIDPNVWINKVDEKVRRRVKYASYFNKGSDASIVSIITDLRQPNEYKYCRDNGFHIIRIKASDKTRMARMKADGDNVSLGDLKHETETYVDSYDVDYEINNDSLSSSSIYNIELQVEKIVADILTKEDGNNE